MKALRKYLALSLAAICMSFTFAGNTEAAPQKNEHNKVVISQNHKTDAQKGTWKKTTENKDKHEVWKKDQENKDRHEAWKKAHEDNGKHEGWRKDRENNGKHEGWRKDHENNGKHEGWRKDHENNGKHEGWRKDHEKDKKDEHSKHNITAKHHHLAKDGHRWHGGTSGTIFYQAKHAPNGHERCTKSSHSDWGRHFHCHNDNHKHYDIFGTCVYDNCHNKDPFHTAKHK